MEPGMQQISLPRFAPGLYYMQFALDGFKGIARLVHTGLAIVMNPDSDPISTLPSNTDYTANGPYKTAIDTNVGPNKAYMIIRPETLGANGFLHAPIIYGHGSGGQVSGFTNFLKVVASHGFVIIASNSLNGGAERPAIVAWLRYWIYNDSGARN